MSGSVLKEAYCELVKIYSQLDIRLQSLEVECSGCGRCCDFSNVDFRLWASVLEVDYMDQTGGDVSPGTVTRCRYLAPDGQCRNREGRVLGCRIYFCRGDQPGLQMRYERFLGRIRQVHRQMGLHWQYVDVLQWFVEAQR